MNREEATIVRPQGLRPGLYDAPEPEMYGLPFTVDEFHGMPYRRLGRSGLRVSNVGLGTWKFGYPETGDGARQGEATALGILDRAAELGITFWDTASRYNHASGNSERVIGKWLDSNSRNRRDIVLATKVFPLMDGRTPNHCWASRTNITEGVYASLERLRTDYIDLLYLHFFDQYTLYDETLCAVEDLIRRDLVRYLGVSNYSVENLTTCQAIQKQCSSTRCQIVAVQNQFDILRGEVGEYGGTGVLKYCAQHDISFVAWSPLAGGLVSDRFTEPADARAGDRLFDENLVNVLSTSAVAAKLHKLQELSSKWSLSLTQLALSFMLSIEGMGPVIPAVSSVDQLESNAEAGALALEPSQFLAIAEVLELGPGQ